MASVLPGHEKVYSADNGAWIDQAKAIELGRKMFEA